MCRQLTISQRRLQKLAQTALPISDDGSSATGTSTPSTPIPSASGLSITALRQVIRRVERSIESDLIDSADQDLHLDNQVPETEREHGNRNSEVLGRTGKQDREAEEDGPTLKVFMKDSQLRMAVWLNSLPWKKTLTWYPEISNSHAVIIVR